MKISSAAFSCRYLPAIASSTETPTGFGGLLRDCGIWLPSEMSLRLMVSNGWIAPRIRVALSRDALDSWRNYPEFTMLGTDTCPEADRWTLDLWGKASTNVRPRNQTQWWLHFLDDPHDSITKAAQAHRIALTDADLPDSFTHRHTGRVIQPWIDYYAYWQAFHVAELVATFTVTAHLVGDFDASLGQHWDMMVSRARSRAEAIRSRWERRETAFERLARLRTVIGAVSAGQREGKEIESGIRSVAEESGIRAQELREDVRDVLLVMWKEAGANSLPDTRPSGPLRALVRQEIEYALGYLQCLTSEPINFLDDFWHDARNPHEWANLIDALPLEHQLAKTRFASRSLIYLRDRVRDLPALSTWAESSTSELLTHNWHRSGPLRRFVVAFHRLHEELAGEEPIGYESVIRSGERIEQFNLIMLHAQRVLTAEYRENSKDVEDPDNPDLARWLLRFVFIGWGSGVEAQASAEAAVSRLVKRANLRTISSMSRLPMLQPGEVATGSAAADQIVAAVVNLLIARNHAAHHDHFDADLVYPSESHVDAHMGNMAIAAALVCVIAVLSVRK